MKRIIGLAIAIAALGALAAAAQPGKDRAEGRKGRGHRAAAVIEYLGLSADQQQQWQALHERHREDMKPLFEEGRALRQRVQESLEADEPAIDVGDAVKAAHAHRQRMKQAREAFEAELKAVLDGAQKEKFEAFKAAREMGRKGRRGRSLRRGGRPAPGPESTIEG